MLQRNQGHCGSDCTTTSERTESRPGVPARKREIDCVFLFQPFCTVSKKHETVQDWRMKGWVLFLKRIPLLSLWIELCFLRIQSFGPREHQIRNQRTGDCKQEVCHGTIQLGSIIYFTPKTIESRFIKEIQLSWYCWGFRNPAKKTTVWMVPKNPS